MERREHMTIYKRYQITYQIYTPPFPACGTPTMQNLTAFPDYQQFKANHHSLFYWDELKEVECYQTVLQHQWYHLREWSLLKTSLLVIYFEVKQSFSSKLKSWAE